MQSLEVVEYELLSRRIAVTVSRNLELFEILVNRSEFQNWIVNTQRNYFEMPADEFETPIHYVHISGYWDYPAKVLHNNHLKEFINERPALLEQVIKHYETSVI